MLGLDTNCLYLSLTCAAPLGHLDGLRVPPAAAGLDGGGLEGGGPQGDGLAALDQQLQDLRVHQALHRLAIDVRHQVAGAQAGVEGGRALVHLMGDFSNF